MADHTALRAPDYDLKDELIVDSSVAFKALADPTRATIIMLVEHRASSINELATTMDKPKGSVGHHVKALEAAGLIAVVRTRQVRAITEKFYGRTARWFIISGLPATGPAPVLAIQQAFGWGRESTDLPAEATARYARISPGRAQEYVDELIALVDRFKSEHPTGDTVYAIVVGLFPTDRPHLPDENSDESGSTSG